MKKLFLVFVLMLSVVILVGCGKFRVTTKKRMSISTTRANNTVYSTTTNNKVSQNTARNNELSLISSLLNKEYNHINISVKNLYSDDTQLESTYSIDIDSDSKTINYSYEMLNEIVIEDGIIYIPEEMISSYTGKIIYQGDTLISNTGEININIENLELSNININPNSLSNISNTSNTFDADISASEYMGITNFNNMHIKIEYNSTKIVNIIISYDSVGINTIIMYELQ